MLEAPFLCSQLIIALLLYRQPYTSYQARLEVIIIISYSICQGRRCAVFLIKSGKSATFRIYQFVGAGGRDDSSAGEARTDVVLLVVLEEPFLDRA